MSHDDVVEFVASLLPGALGSDIRMLFDWRVNGQVIPFSR